MFKTFNPEHCLSLFVVLLLEHIFNFNSHINLVTINYGFTVALFDFLQNVVCILTLHHAHNE